MKERSFVINADEFYDMTLSTDRDQVHLSFKDHAAFIDVSCLKFIEVILYAENVSDVEVFKK